MTPQKAKFAKFIAPALVDNASFTAVVVDRVGFMYLELMILLGALDVALSALKLQECDTADGDFTDVPGCIFGTSKNSAGAASTLPTADDDGKLYLMNVNLEGRKRFLKLVATAGNGDTGVNLAAIGRLSLAEVVPSTAAGMGADQVLQAPAFA